MRKQGFMKRVLGGIMAVAFGAALCFAAPVKAEAATPWTTPVPPNEGEYWAAVFAGQAEKAGVFAQWSAEDMQYYLKEQLGAQMNVAQTTAATKQHLATLGFARQAASTLPPKYASKVIGVINENYGALRTEAIDYIDGENYYAAVMAIKAENALLDMQYYLGRQQTFLIGAQAAAYAGAFDRAVTAQQLALVGAISQMQDQIDAVNRNIWSAMGYGVNYGF